MIAAIAESFIQKFCGKYLKNFGPENISISLSGTITLLKVEFRMEELNKFQLPYTPLKASINQIDLDLPLMIGSCFKVAVQGLLVVFSKGTNSLNDLRGEDMEVLVQSMIQNWIAFFYFSLLSLPNNAVDSNSAHGKKNAPKIFSKISTAEFENNHRMLDMFVVNLTDIHILVEECLVSHISRFSGFSVNSTFGLKIASLELRPPKPEEQTYYDGLSASNSTDSSKILTLKKFLKCSKLNVHFAGHNESDVIENLSFTAAFATNFQKNSPIVGPSFLSIVSDNIRIQITDEQLFFLSHFSQVLKTYFHNLRAKSRSVLCNQRFPSTITPSSPDGCRTRARMRWALVKKAVRVDWWKFADSLTESDLGGRLKWRSWFQMWRLAARYVSIRELITYHVGYEAFKNVESGVTTYAAKEKLLMYYERLRNVDKSNIYQGPACFSPQLLSAAEAVISSRYYHSSEDIARQTESSQYVTLEDGDTIFLNEINPFALPDDLIKALYAAQLELDAFLPFKISAFCRIYADEKCEFRHQQAIGSAEEKNTDVDSLVSTGAVVFLGLVHGTNLRPNFASTFVTSYCSLESDYWADSEGSTVFTSDAIGKVNPTSGLAFAIWAESFSLPLFAEDSVDGLGKGKNASFTLSCYNKGLLNISYGSRVVAVKSLLTAQDLEAFAAHCRDWGSHESVAYTGSMEALDVSLQSSLILAPNSNSSSNSNNESLVELRIVSCCAMGSTEHIKSAGLKFKDKLKQIADEQQTLLERRYQLLLRQEEDDEPDSQFVLDPSLLTIQDFKIKLSIPSIEISSSMLRRLSNDANSMSLHPLTVLRVTLTRLLLQGTVSNNPWNATVSASLSRFNVKTLQEKNISGVEGEQGGEEQTESDEFPFSTGSSDDLSHKDSCLRSILSLPRIRGNIQLSQTSTLARKLDGLLDSTCFDYTATVSLFPVTMTFRPQSFSSSACGMSDETMDGSSFSSSSSSSFWANIWKASTPLSHLFIQRANWAKGFSSYQCHSMEASSDARPQELGGRYEPYPKHLNVVTSLLAATRSWFSSTGGAGQKTSIRCVTPVRTLDIDISLPCEEAPATSQSQSVNNLPGVTSPPPPPPPPPSSLSSSFGAISSPAPINFFDWFSYPSAAASSAPIAPPKSSTTNHDVIAASTYIEPPEVKEEREFLLKRIEELEDKVRILSLGN